MRGAWPPAAPDAVEVIPGLTIGSVPTSRGARALARSGVTQAIDLRAAGSAVDWPDGVTAQSCPLVEFAAPDLATLDAISARVAGLVDGGGSVFVHCREGIQRAPLVACAALLQMGWPLADAYRLVSTRRTVAALSEDQLGVLRALDHRRRQRPDTEESRAAVG